MSDDRRSAAVLLALMCVFGGKLEIKRYLTLLARKLGDLNDEKTPKYTVRKLIKTSLKSISSFPFQNSAPIVVHLYQTM